MARQINKNLKHLATSFKTGKSGAILEGSSRSGKTFASVDNIILLASRYLPNSKGIITRETLASFKTTLADDFNRRLPEWGLSSPFQESQNVSQFDLLGTKIHLLGTDNPNRFEGAGSDWFYMNEGLDQPNAIFDHLEQRCRKFFWIDYNPKVTSHWIYDKLCNRPDISFCHSTFKDNPFISEPELRKILSYEPWEPGSYEVIDNRIWHNGKEIDEKNTPPAHPVNVKAGTADPYRWMVYGLGLRMAQEGLVFKNINWIDEFPKDVDRYWYGLDFGFTNSPTALCKVACKGNEIYAEVLIYQPTENADILEQLMRAVGVKNENVWADAAAPIMISDLRNKYKFRCFPAKKFPGSIDYGIDLLKRYKLNIVKNLHARKEAENYCYRSIHGIQTNEPIDDHNHFFDSLRYSVQHELRKL
jgi:phage terminase large subunit